jgi:hypothetical protein
MSTNDPALDLAWAQGRYAIASEWHEQCVKQLQRAVREQRQARLDMESAQAKIRQARADNSELGREG